MTEFQGVLFFSFIGLIFLFGKPFLRFIIKIGHPHLYFLTFATICCFCNLPDFGLFLGYITYLIWPMKPTKIL